MGHGGHWTTFLNHAHLHLPQLSRTCCATVLLLSFIQNRHHTSTCARPAASRLTPPAFSWALPAHYSAAHSLPLLPDAARGTPLPWICTGGQGWWRAGRASTRRRRQAGFGLHLARCDGFRRLPAGGSWGPRMKAGAAFNSYFSAGTWLKTWKDMTAALIHPDMAGGGDMAGTSFGRLPLIDSHSSSGCRADCRGRAMAAEPHALCHFTHHIATPYTQGWDGRQDLSALPVPCLPATKLPQTVGTRRATGRAGSLPRGAAAPHCC